MFALIKFTISCLLLIVIFGSSGKAIYLSLKAELAQILLMQAWEKSNATQKPVNPWPWADIQAVGLLSIPRLGIEQVVLNNQQSEALAFGPGLLSDGTTRVLSAHRDSHFAFLAELRKGDKIDFTSIGNDIESFTVDRLEITNINQYSTISPPHDTLTLITCYPFEGLGSNSNQRYLVVATPDSAP